MPGGTGTYEGDRDWMDNQIAWIKARSAIAFTYYSYAISEYDGGDDHAALGHLITCMSNVVSCVETLHMTYAPFYPESAWIFMIDTWLHVDGDVDMDAILSAMVAADVEQVTYFVGLVDAYRVGIWNRPFNAEFFAALARGWTV